MSQSEYWTDFMRRRLSRRGLLKAGAVAGAGLYVGSTLVGCSDGDTTAKPGEGTSGAPRKGGTLRFSSTGGGLGEYAGVDPHINRHFAAPAYEKLVKYTPKKDKIVPWLAESWEIPDDTTYVFKLKQGVKFHNAAPVNGREFTAEDVVYNMERALKSEGGQYFVFPFVSTVDKATAVDKYTVKMTTKAPFAPLLNNLAVSALYIMPKEIVGSDNVAKTAIGTGPFMFDHWDPGDAMVFKRNPDYHVAGQPFMDGIEVRLVEDYTVLTAQFLSDQVDVATLFAQDTKIVREKRPKAQWVPGDANSHFTFFFRAGFKPTDDLRVRQAMDLMIDRPSMTTSVVGGANDTFHYAWASGPISRSLTNWALPQAELEKKPGYMEKYPKAEALAQAKALMAEAGYADGFDMVISNTPESYRDIACQLAQQWWKEIGIRATIKVSDNASFQAAGSKGEFQCMLWYTGGGSPDPDGQLYPFLRTGSPRNWHRWSDPELDKMLDAQRTTVDQAKRKTIVTDIQRKLLDTVAAIWIFEYTGFSFATEKLMDVEAFKSEGYVGSFPIWDYISQAWLTK